MKTPEDEALRWQLKELRRAIEPDNDLWPGIAARVAAIPGEVAAAPRPRFRRFVPWAMAASMLLAIGATWQMAHIPPSQAPGDPIIRQQAVSMALDYEKALARLQQGGSPVEMHAAFADLDSSAAQILSAIDRQPDALFLLEQLRRTYAVRLQLTQRATMT